MPCSLEVSKARSLQAKPLASGQWDLKEEGSVIPCTSYALQEREEALRHPRASLEDHFGEKSGQVGRLCPGLGQASMTIPGRSKVESMNP